MKKLFAFLAISILLPLTTNAQRGSQPVNRPTKVKRRRAIVSLKNS